MYRIHIMEDRIPSPENKSVHVQNDRCYKWSILIIH